MTKYTVINDFDGNEQFEVEGKNVEEAALAALETLGWNLCSSDE